MFTSIDLATKNCHELFEESLEMFLPVTLLDPHRAEEDGVEFLNDRFGWSLKKTSEVLLSEYELKLRIDY